MFKNRKEQKLPNYSCNMEIQKEGKIYKGIWKPFDKKNYNKENMPSESYLGSFVFESPQNDYKISGTYGFHAWENSDSEFLEYRILLE